MRTRRNPRNQEILWRELGKQGATPVEKSQPPVRTDAEIDAMFWLSKTSRNLLKRDAAKTRDRPWNPPDEICKHDRAGYCFDCIRERHNQEMLAGKFDDFEEKLPDPAPEPDDAIREEIAAVEFVDQMLRGEVEP